MGFFETNDIYQQTEKPLLLGIILSVSSSELVWQCTILEISTTVNRIRWFSITNNETFLETIGNISLFFFYKFLVKHNDNINCPKKPTAYQYWWLISKKNPSNCHLYILISLGQSAQYQLIQLCFFLKLRKVLNELSKRKKYIRKAKCDEYLEESEWIATVIIWKMEKLPIHLWWIEFNIIQILSIIESVFFLWIG